MSFGFVSEPFTIALSAVVDGVEFWGPEVADGKSVRLPTYSHLVSDLSLRTVLCYECP